MPEQTTPLSKGKNLWSFFRVDDTGSAYSILKPDGSALTPGTADAIVTLKLLKGGKFTPQTDGSKKAVVTQYHAGKKLLNDLLVGYASPDEAAGSGTQAVTWIDGDKYDPAVSSSGKIVLMIGYGYIDPEEDKRLVMAHAFYISSDSGEIDINGENDVVPLINLTSVKLIHDLVIPAELFEPTLVTVASPITIVAGKHLEPQWLAYP